MNTYAVMLVNGKAYVRADEYQITDGVLSFFRDSDGVFDHDEAIVAYAAGSWVGVSNTAFSHDPDEKDPAPPNEEPGQV